MIFDTTANADMYYAVRADIGDPFLYLEDEKGRYAYLDEREYGAYASKKTRRAIPVLLDASLIRRVKDSAPDGSFAEKLCLYAVKERLKKHRIVTVPDGFPVRLADYLRAHQVRLAPVPLLFPERAVKSDAEIRGIAQAIAKVKAAFAVVEGILRSSAVIGSYVYFKGRKLTSEFLRSEAEAVLARSGMHCAEPPGMIIASGSQTAYPHHGGSGPILANAPIIVDIFPRNRSTGLYADMTRTFVKGNPTAELSMMIRAVKDAGVLSSGMLKPGIKASDVHRAVCEFFEHQGYHHGDRGFIHATGHGLGYSVHEAPVISAGNDVPLAPGNVVTIEPGLYYEGAGGVRIEDVYVITESGAEKLTKYHKNAIIT